MTTKRRFTSKWIESLKRPAAGRVEFVDTQDTHLVLRVGTRSATFQWLGRSRGRMVRRTLGNSATMSVSAARQASKRMAVDLAAGDDPLVEKRRKAAMPTVAELFQRRLDLHARPRLRRIVDYVWTFDKHFGPIAKRKIDEVTLADVVKWHAGMGETSGQAAANRAVGLLRSLYARTEELVGVEVQNPCRRLKRYPEPPRARFMSAEELRKFSKALDTLPETQADLFRVGLLCGARRGNLMAMRYDQLDLDHGRWIVPASEFKSRRDAVVYLAQPVVEILRKRQAKSRSPWVFPSDTKSGHVERLQYFWAKLVEAAGLEDLRMHDVRRSFASHLAMSGIPLAAIAKALGHSDIRTVQVYARFSEQAVAQHVEQGAAAIVAMLPAPAVEVTARTSTSSRRKPR